MLDPASLSVWPDMAKQKMDFFTSSPGGVV
jgi:hypothetical protein